MKRCAESGRRRQRRLIWLAEQTCHVDRKPDLLSQIQTEEYMGVPSIDLAEDALRRVVVGA